MSLIEFKQNIEQEAYNIEKFTSPGDIYGGKEEIFKNHPQLKNALQGKDTLPTEDRRRVIKIYLKKYYQENKADYAKGAKRIKSAWNKIEKPVIKTLCQVMDYQFSRAPWATANIGSITIYPRDIEERSFQLCFYQHTHDALVTITHEYTHFLYFDKWKELFPQDIPKAYSAPSIFWQLSEILAVVINSDKKLLKIIPDAGFQGFYFNGQSYHNLAVPNTPYSILGYFQKIYMEHVESSSPFKSFLKKCRQEIIKLDKKMKLANGKS